MPKFLDTITYHVDDATKINANTFTITPIYTGYVSISMPLSEETLYFTFQTTLSLSSIKQYFSSYFYEDDEESSFSIGSSRAPTQSFLDRFRQFKLNVVGPDTPWIGMTSHTSMVMAYLSTPSTTTGKWNIVGFFAQSGNLQALNLNINNSDVRIQGKFYSNDIAKVS